VKPRDTQTPTTARTDNTMVPSKSGEWSMVTKFMLVICGCVGIRVFNRTAAFMQIVRVADELWYWWSKAILLKSEPENDAGC